MYTPDPSSIQRFRASGTGDMGSVSNEYSVARFSLDVPRFLPVFVRGTWTDLTGGTPANADLAVRIDHNDTSGLHDHTLATFSDMGTGSGGNLNLHLRLQADELYAWIADQGEYLVFEWTNPDSGYMRWALEVGLIDAALLRGA